MYVCSLQSQVSALHDNHTALTSELATMGQHCQQLLSLGDSYNSIVGAIRALEEKITSHMEHVSHTVGLCMVPYMPSRYLSE